VAGWIDAALDSGDAIPPPSSLDAVRANPDCAGWTYGVVSVDRPCSTMPSKGSM